MDLVGGKVCRAPTPNATRVWQGAELDRLAVVVATYNEAENLPRLIEALEALPLPAETRIYVVDDNSPDGTSQVARDLASRYGNITVITRPGKQGLGSALRDGMTAALEGEFTRILTLDADLSHDPQDVPRLLEESQATGADLVQASRYVKGGRTVNLGWRWLPSRVANLLLHRLLGAPHEATTNFRVYGRKLARYVVQESRGRDFEFQPECALIAMRHGLRIVEVPITFAVRARGESKLGLVQDFRLLAFFAWALVSYRLGLGRLSRRPPTPRCPPPP